MARKLFVGDILTIISVVLIFMGLATALFLFGKYKSLLVLVALFLIGNGFYFLGMVQTNYKDYQGLVNVTCRVTDKFVDQGSSCKCYVDDVTVNGEKAKGIYLRIYYDDEKVKVGDKLEFTTTLTRIKAFELGNFNNSLLRNNCGYTASVNMKYTSIVGNHIKFDEFPRLKVRTMFHANMSEQNAEICYALLFGDKMGIDSEIKDNYDQAGIFHVLTVSGLHVGFLIALLYFILRKCRMGRLSTTIVTSIFLLLYNFLCGFTPSVLRASIMALVVMLAKLSGHEYDNVNALGLAGFIILCVNPLYAFDIGFLMSFCSVASIFMLYPVVSSALKRVMNDKVAEGIGLSLSAEFGILPFLAVLFKNLNFLSFFVNLIIVPIFAIIYPILFVCTLICLLMPFISKILVIFTPFINFINVIAEFFSKTILKIQMFPFDVLLIAVLFILAFIVSRYLIVKKIYKVAFMSAMSMVFVISAIMNFYPVKWGTSVSSIMTSYSSSLLLTTKSEQRLLINEELDISKVNNFCYNNKVKNIDFVFDYSRPDDKVVDYYSSFGASSLLVADGESNNFVTKLDSDLKYYLGDYEIVLSRYGESYLVEITFDGLEFCFASSGKMSYNESEQFEKRVFQSGYDFVYFESRCWYFSNGEYKVVGVQNGNYRYNFTNNKFNLRGLD